MTTVYAKITSVNNAGLGIYKENYSIYSSATLDADYPSGLSPCEPTLPSNGANVGLSFSVSANVVAACTVSGAEVAAGSSLGPSSIRRPA